jgi:hypothetical protein
MTWEIWTVIGVVAVLFIFDWLIVMGINPKKWKGGKKDE